MPITRTVSGIIHYDEFDALSGWTFFSHASGYGTASHSIDSSDKQSGSGSDYIALYSPGGAAGTAVGFLQKTINVGPGGARLHVFHKVDISSWIAYPNYAIGIGGPNVNDPTQTWCLHNSAFYSHGWQLANGLITPSGNQTVWANYNQIEYTSSANERHSYGHIDKLVIYASDDVIVTGLVPGQKVEIYRTSDDAKLDTKTCAGGETSVTLVLSATEDVPEQIYLKIYSTDGNTLLDTTTSTEICGGDTWDWYAPGLTLSLSTDVPIIYRTAATGTPKTCNVTANLKTTGGADYPGATIYFTTTLGSVSPASDVTDANGNAETALTSTTHGLAVVKANWLGDLTVPACSAYIVVHVFYEAEAPDTAKDFQFYVEGIEYAYVGGRYTQNELGDVNDFDVEIPEWLSTITINGFVNIYRKGVKEFHGILNRPNRSLSDSPRVVLKGPDVSVLLNDKIVDTKIYAAKTPQFIIGNLLTSFPCGITAGSLGTNATSLTITVENETLAKAIPRICDLVGWKYRVNLDRTLDFAESFSGGTSSAAFTESTDILMLDRQTNYSAVANYIRMKGTGIYSIKQDGTKIQEQGIHQAAAFNKSISDQDTLDAACQAYLDMRKVEDETIPFEVIDAYTPGTFGPEDYITVTSPTTGLSGTYQIRKIERDLADPNAAKLDLVNKTKEYWELDTEYRRMTKDANV